MHPNDTLLNDYVDETLDPAGQTAVEEHVAGCVQCQALANDLRAIRAAATSLEHRDPPARAWPRLERAITFEHELRPTQSTPNLPSSDLQRTARVLRATWTWLAATAAIVIAVFVGMKYRPTPTPASTGAATATNPSGAASSAEPSAQSVEAELRAAEDHYEKAIRGLEQVTNAEKGAFDSQTAATLQKNLAVIDQAISESRAAVRAQPASQPAQDSLIESFKAKLALLQDTVALINEMRKGNEAGAARIGSGLTKKG